MEQSGIQHFPVTRCVGTCSEAAPGFRYRSIRATRSQPRLRARPDVADAAWSKVVSSQCGLRAGIPKKGASPNRLTVIDAEVPSPQLSGLVEIVGPLGRLLRPIRVQAPQQYQECQRQASLENQLAIILSKGDQPTSLLACQAHHGHVVAAAIVVGDHQHTPSCCAQPCCTSSPSRKSWRHIWQFMISVCSW